MNKYYSCPACGKVSYEYGCCSEKCRKETEQIFKQVNEMTVKDTMKELKNRFK